MYLHRPAMLAPLGKKYVSRKDKELPWGAMRQHLKQDPKDGIILLQVGILDKECQWPGHTNIQPQPVKDSHSSTLAGRLLQVHCMVQGPASSLEA